MLAFDDVAAHDIGWGAKSVDWVSRGKVNNYKQAYVSCAGPNLLCLPYSLLSDTTAIALVWTAFPLQN